MLVDVHFDLITVGTSIGRPDFGLAKAHLVEHLGGKSGTMIGQPFGVAEAAVHGDDHARFAAHIPGRATVPQHRPRRHHNAIARRKARGLLAVVPTHAGGVTHHGIFAWETRRPFLV